MSLAPGVRLGPYEITMPLGAGGMGEVYRARDTKLNREVAIKVLPAEVAGDPERLARFEREAQLLAALHHQERLAVRFLEAVDGGDVRMNGFDMLRRSHVDTLGVIVSRPAEFWMNLGARLKRDAAPGGPAKPLASLAILI